MPGKRITDLQVTKYKGQFGGPPGTAPRIVSRDTTSLKDYVRILSDLGIPTGSLKVMASTAEALASLRAGHVLAEEQVEPTPVGQLSRADKRRQLGEYAIEVAEESTARSIYNRDLSVALQ